MNALRETLSSVTATAVTHFVSDIHGAVRSGSLSTPSSISGDESSDKSQAIPNTLIKEQWQLILGQDATISELDTAIDRCKEFVLQSDECSNERKWLVRHLVELRFRIKELEEAIEDPNAQGPSVKVILGHHFSPHMRVPTTRQYCDHCSGIIWSVVQASLICSDCSYIVHHKCVENVVRICAHVIASERKFPIPDICPEIGLAAQWYKCEECHTLLNSKRSWIEPRLCDYSGRYYCQTCHWNDSSIIPARVVHNWDFTSKRVCRASLQEINLLLEKPVINLEEANPKLFVFLQKLSIVKKVREYLSHMRKYLTECRIAVSEKLIELHIGTTRHLMQSADLYSISDLVRVESGALIDYLNKVFDVFGNHIRGCDICSGKGYICEICGNDEIIYPFDDGTVPCTKCHTIYHRVCWIRKNMSCPKCCRFEERKQQKENELQDEKNGN